MEIIYEIYHDINRENTFFRDGFNAGRTGKVADDLAGKSINDITVFCDGYSLGQRIKEWEEEIVSLFKDNKIKVLNRVARLEDQVTTLWLDFADASDQAGRDMSLLSSEIMELIKSKYSIEVRGSLGLPPIEYGDEKTNYEIKAKDMTPPEAQDHLILLVKDNFIFEEILVKCPERIAALRKRSAQVPPATPNR